MGFGAMLFTHPLLLSKIFGARPFLTTKLGVSDRASGMTHGWHNKHVIYGLIYLLTAWQIMLPAWQTKYVQHCNLFLDRFEAQQIKCP